MTSGRRRQFRRALLGLQPIQKAEAYSLRVLQGARGIERRAVEQAAIPVIVPRPVEHREVLFLHQAAVSPEAALRARQLLVQAVLQPAARLAVDLAAVDLDAQAVRLRGLVVLVFLRAGNDVAFAFGAAFARERVGEALHAMRLCFHRLRLRARRSAPRSPRRSRAPHRTAAADRRARSHRSPFAAGTATGVGRRAPSRRLR